MPTEGRISGFAFRVERRSRSGRIADTTRRTGRDPASFRRHDGTMSRMSPDVIDYCHPRPVNGVAEDCGIRA